MWKKSIAYTTKTTDMDTRKGIIKKMLVGSRPFKRRGWLPLNEAK